MALTDATVRRIFEGLEQGDAAAFFSHVAEDVDWTVMGTHPLGGRYRTKEAFRAATFARLAKALPSGAQLRVEPAKAGIQGNCTGRAGWPDRPSKPAATPASTAQAISARLEPRRKWR